MIGIIYDALTAFPIIERITEKIPQATIYLYKEEVNDIDLVIDKLLNKNCQIIILKEINQKIQNKYPNIKFITLKNIKNNNSYIIDNKELLEAINNKDIDKINSILQNIKIPKDKIIIINNPKLLFIKSIIEKDFSNQIIDNLDYLILEINKYLKLEDNNKGNCFIIT